MVVFVITDSDENYARSNGSTTQRLLENLADDVCLVTHFRRWTPALQRELRPWAVCHSGSAADYKDYDILRHEAYRQAVRECPAAQIGFCGGHQILAHTFGSTLGPMRKLRRGEPDPSGYHPGQYKEWGVFEVRITRRDPLFKGFGSTLRVQEYHYWEVKKLAPNLMRLASTPNCRVQAFVHRARPHYGVQFHPEQSPAAYPDGTRLLRNFFGIARAWRRRDALRAGTAPATFP